MEETLIAGSPQWWARVSELEAQEAQEPLQWWYLSFAGPKEWRGACLVQARGITNAIKAASVKGINPGGEVKAIPVGPHYPESLPVNELLTKEQLGEGDPAEAVKW